MKRIIFFIAALMIAVSIVSAKSDAFSRANELYGKAKYSEAAKLYEEILNNEGVAPEIYYNLGNAYYKMSETGLSILNYERALRLRPNYENAKVNLELSELRVVDNVHQISSFFVVRWFEEIIIRLTTNQWLYLSTALFVLSIGLILFFIFSFSVNLRKFSFYSALIVFIISMSTLFFSYVKKNVVDERKEAIIMVGAVTAKSSPDRSGTNLFQVHEGTKVLIQSNLGSWTEIKLGNGNIGWIESKNLEII